MKTAIMLRKQGATAALNWAARFAGEPDKLLYVFYVAECNATHCEEEIHAVSDGAIRAQLTALAASKIFPQAVDIRAVRVAPRNTASAIETAVEELKIERFVVPRGRGVKSDSEEFALGRKLFRDLHCEVVQLSVGDSNGERCERIIVGVGTGDATAIALQLAADLAQQTGGKVSALYVEPDEGDLAADAARRMTERIVADSVRTHRDRVETVLVSATDVVSGLKASAVGHQLVMLGASHHSVIHRWLFSSISEKLIAQHDGPTLAVLRPALPWGNRVTRALSQVIVETVPQLDRGRRLNLFERIQAASQWNFDFVALISLSTLIATLGLMQNSAAVVIGAMLVAPLMTPLLGIGLALTQGNALLGRTSSRTVGLGFVFSFGIGWLTAMVFPSTPITEQVVARGSPGVVDLLVAFFSGVAAAYAIGRPNLLSALPGVAIAAALVPPVASSAIGLARQEYALAGGASLLFLTNIVAIVLGAAMSFWLAGIRIMHTHGGFARWSRRVSSALLLLAIGLAVYESIPRDVSKRRLRSAAEKIIANTPNVELGELEIYGQRAQLKIAIPISAPEPLDEVVREQLFSEAADLFPAATIEIRFQQVWRYEDQQDE